jgi:hypothetical protein
MKYLSICFFIISLCLGCGQNKTIKEIVSRAADLEIDTLKQNTDQNPDIILVIGNTTMVLDTVNIQKINPDWIDKIEIMKSNRAKSLFTDTIKFIYVYPKRKYHSKIKKLLMITYIINSYHDNLEMMINSPKC